ncbi:hypothetical protein [Lentzea sp. NPDC059081]|uniref:hypothetical protein n=1 Tax=Lentzea sp. NPDC059081 TaxID=3346719 RepID=UPI0036C2F37E
MPLTRTLLAAGVVAAAAVAVTAVVATSPDHGSGPSALAGTALHHESLIADCMRARGFDYEVALPRDVAVEEARRVAVARHQNPQVAVARAQASAPPDPNQARVGALPADQQRAWGDALYGDDSWKGCYYATYEQAWGENLDQRAEEADALVVKVRADPSVQAAERAYLLCMAERGHRLAGPDDVHRLIGEARDRLAAAAADQYEKDVNSAHATCVMPYQKAYDATYQRLVHGG